MRFRLLYRFICGHADFCQEWQPRSRVDYCEKCGPEKHLDEVCVVLS